MTSPLALMAKHIFSDRHHTPPANGLAPAHIELEHEAAYAAHTDNSHHLAGMRPWYFDTI